MAEEGNERPKKKRKMAEEGNERPKKKRRFSFSSGIEKGLVFRARRRNGKKKTKKISDVDKEEDTKGAKKKSEKKEMSKEEMEKIFDDMKKKLSDVQKELLTRADIDITNMEQGELLLSWKCKKPDLVGVPTTQQADDCWAHALSRGLTIKMKKEGLKAPFPTPEELVNAVEGRHLGKDNAIKKVKYIAPYLLSKYKQKLVIHRRDRGGDHEKNKRFEKLIERLLAKYPVAMSFEYVPSYHDFSHEHEVGHQKKVFCPGQVDQDAIMYERMESHLVVITGHGLMIRDGKEIEFWECLDSQGEDHGDGGYIRLERHKCLIHTVYDFQVSR